MATTVRLAHSITAAQATANGMPTREYYVGEDITVSDDLARALTAGGYVETDPSGPATPSDDPYLTTAAAATTYGPTVGTTNWLKLHAGGNLDALLTGTITRNSDGAVTSAGVVWPDGKTGTYTATTLSTAFPGSVDAYTVTWAGPPSKTVTQPAVTRDATTGAVTTRPAMTVA